MEPFFAPTQYPSAASSARGALAAVIDSDGETRGRGAISIHEGSSHTILVADGSADASCADLDDDGVAGLVRLTIELRDIRTGETFAGVISPVEGEVDESSRVKARLSFERGEPTDLTFDGWLRVHFFDQH